MFLPGFWYRVGHEESMKVARSFAIPSELDIGPDAGTGQIRPGRGLHLQHQVKFFMRKLPAQFPVAARAGFFIDNDKADIIDVG